MSLHGGLGAQEIGDRRAAYIGRDVSKYEVLYGEPMYWSLSLIVSPTDRHEPQRNRAIVTRGVLFVFSRPGADPEVRLCEETLKYCLALTRPVPEIGAEFFGDAPFRHLHEAQVVGAFTDEGFLFWSVDSAPPRDRTRALGPDRGLEDLVTRPDRFVGRTVTVRGQFRGANLFGDFPAGKGGKDWVLREGPFSIWITGRDPSGPGWRLDTASPADCVWNIEAEGKVERRAEAVFVKARRVRLLGRDPDASCVGAARR
jgi:hypothetical protein